MEGLTPQWVTPFPDGPLSRTGVTAGSASYPVALDTPQPTGEQPHLPQGNRDRSQGVTITAPDDTDFTGAAIPLSHRSSGAGYGAPPPQWW